MEKLQVLLGHWIEHNAAHEEEFARWAERARQEGLAAVAAELAAAVNGLREATRALGQARARLGPGGDARVPE